LLTDDIITKHPVATTAILGVSLCLVTYCFDYIPFHFPFDAVVYRAVLCGLLILFMFRLSLQKTLGFTLRSFGVGLVCGGLFLLFGIWVLINNLLASEPSFSLDVVDFICRMAMIGIMEELIFRGALLNILIKTGQQTTAGVYRAVLWSSLLFGLLHYMNLIYTPFIETSIQVYNAICLGILFAAVYLRCKNIWACAFLHAFWNFAGSVGFSIFQVAEETVQEAPGSITALQALGSLIEPTLFLLLGLFLLRSLSSSSPKNAPKGRFLGNISTVNAE